MEYIEALGLEVRLEISDHLYNILFFQHFQNKQAMLLSMSYLNKGYNQPTTQVIRWSCLFAFARNFFCPQSLLPFTLIITVSPLAVDNISWMSKFYTALKGVRFVVILSSSRTRLHSLEPAAEKALCCSHKHHPQGWQFHSSCEMQLSRESVTTVGEKQFLT